ncbi:hypothetical protein MA16_Dca025645 [Dendrobium catenatum]|uniref:Uncharacterized protein n=1 Tax=Dendrobium catenatum TaxID=906689 RepID=A0A2I0VC74_9ASPA|nr:hypothetical protein MA16_Dca025645 [Dendrobium catenatum]
MITATEGRRPPTSGGSMEARRSTIRNSHSPVRSFSSSSPLFGDIHPSFAQGSKAKLRMGMSLIINEGGSILPSKKAPEVEGKGKALIADNEAIVNMKKNVEAVKTSNVEVSGNHIEEVTLDPHFKIEVIPALQDVKGKETIPNLEEIVTDKEEANKDTMIEESKDGDKGFDMEQGNTGNKHLITGFNGNVVLPGAEAEGVSNINHTDLRETDLVVHVYGELGWSVYSLRCHFSRGFNKVWYNFLSFGAEAVDKEVEMLIPWLVASTHLHMKHEEFEGVEEAAIPEPIPIHQQL